MNIRKQIFMSLFWILLGSILLLCGTAGLLDSYWSGMGGGLLAVGILQSLRHFKYKTDPTYRDSVDRERKDERNRYIANKAWAWAGYWFVLIAAVSSILLKVVGREELVPMAAGSVCLILILYWLSYLYLQKKY